MKTFLLFIWMILSLILVFSLFGLILFIPKDSWQNADSTPSTWCTIGLELLKSVTKAD